MSTLAEGTLADTTSQQPPAKKQKTTLSTHITYQTASHQTDPSATAPTAPQKRYFRQRAHSNPLADHLFLYPTTPTQMNWHSFYPGYFHPDGRCVEESDRMETTVRRVESPVTHRVEFLDVGCGYGGLLIALSPMFPEQLMLGMEIRVKVASYVNQRILALRCQDEQKKQFQNCAVIRTNAMKHMTNFFHKGQLTKIFFLFPDPHFKKKKNKWRIISPTLLSEYAYLLAEGAIVYTITDVLELHTWMATHFRNHPLFAEMSEEEYSTDPVVEQLKTATEEGKKVIRNNGDMYLAIFRRIMPSAEETA